MPGVRARALTALTGTGAGKRAGLPSRPRGAGRRRPAGLRGHTVCSWLRMAERGVSPDLIRVINVPFEAREIAQSCGKGVQITGWGGGPWTVSARLLKACPSGSDTEGDRVTERDRRKGREAE